MGVLFWGFPCEYFVKYISTLHANCALIKDLFHFSENHILN